MWFFRRLFGSKQTNPTKNDSQSSSDELFAPSIAGDLTDLINATAQPLQQRNDRDQNLRKFLDGDVFVMTPGTQGGTRSFTAEAGTQISIITRRAADGSTLLPVFRSLEALQASVREPVRYLRLSARDFLALCLQNRFDAVVVDGGTDPGFMLSRSDVENLASDLIPRDGSPNHTEVVVNRPTQVMIGSPAVPPPTELVEAVKDLAASLPEVAEAYVYWHAVGHTPPCYAVAIRPVRSDPALWQRIRARGHERLAKLAGQVRFDFTVADESLANTLRSMMPAVFSR